MKLSDFEGRFYRTVFDGEFLTAGNYVSEPGCAYITFAENETYVKRTCEKRDVSCIICTEELSKIPVIRESGKGIAVSRNPRAALYLLHNWLASNSSAYINQYEETVIGRNCSIHETAVIPPTGVTIGDGVEIQEFVVVRPGTVIGDNVTVFSGAILGGENHITARDEQGSQFLVRQAGSVHIRSNVSIGYHTFIAKGSFPYDITEIGEYTKIESGVEISHNSKIGKNCLITGQSQICGNCHIGDNVRISPRAVVSNRITVANGAAIDIGAVVVSNVKEGARVAGNFAIEHDKFLLWHRNKLRTK